MILGRFIKGLGGESNNLTMSFLTGKINKGRFLSFWQVNLLLTALIELIQMNEYF